MTFNICFKTLHFFYCKILIRKLLFNWWSNQFHQKCIGSSGVNVLWELQFMGLTISFKDLRGCDAIINFLAIFIYKKRYICRWLTWKWYLAILNTYLLPNCNCRNMGRFLSFQLLDLSIEVTVCQKLSHISNRTVMKLVGWKNKNIRCSLPQWSDWFLEEKNDTWRDANVLHFT